MSDELTPEERKELSIKLFGPDGNQFNKEAFKELVARYREERRDEELGQAIELWLAGWKSEPVRQGSEIMSWYWRRPPKGKRKKGKLFLSTQQAINALHKEQD